MNKIKMITLAASAKGNLEPGQVYSVPGQVSEADAAALVKGGYAVLVQEKAVDSPVIEKPVPAAVESADLVLPEEVEKAVPGEKPKRKK